MADTLTNLFLGKWTYRSFKNIADINTPLDDLIFAMAPLTITEAPFLRLVTRA